MPPRAKVATVGGPSALRKSRQITADYVASLMSYAEILYKAGMGPKGANRPEVVAALIEVGRDVGLPATMALRWIAIVNGAPTIWGDAALALIRSSGLLAPAYPKEWYEGTPGEDDYTACFAIKRIGDTPERMSKFSVADAKRAELWMHPKKLPWQQYPERQLMWRAKGFACRDEFQDVLCGLILTEEALDYPEGTGRVTVNQVEPEKLPPVALTIDPDLDTRVAPESTPAEAFAAATLAPASSAPIPILGEQLDRLGDLADAVRVSRNLEQGSDEFRAAWQEILAPYGVTTIRKLTVAQAAELITALEKQHDPFTSGPASTPVT